MPWITILSPSLLLTERQTVIHSIPIGSIHPLRYKSSSICKRVTLGLKLKAKRAFIDTFPKYPLRLVFFCFSFFLSQRSVVHRLLLKFTIALALGWDVVSSRRRRRRRRRKYTHCTPLFAKDPFSGVYVVIDST